MVPDKRTRIRYKYNAENVSWESTPINIGIEEYTVFLENRRYWIVGQKIGTVVSEQYPTQDQVKKAAKIHLQRLGVVFAKEVRNSKKKRSKGPTRF